MDYRLLVTFACFFVIIGNINEQDKLIEMIQPFFQKNNKPFRQHHPFSGDFQCPSSDSDCSFYNLQESCFVGGKCGWLRHIDCFVSEFDWLQIDQASSPQEQKIPTQVLYGEYPLLIHNRFNRLSLFRDRLIDTSRQAAVPEYTGQLLAFKRLGVHNRSPSY